MKFRITVTASKVMALLLLLASVFLDVYNTKSASTFMFAVPFISALVLGKQGMDTLKEVKNGTNKRGTSAT